MPQPQGLIQKTPLLASCQPHEQPTLQHALTPNSDDEWPKEPRAVHRNKLCSLCDIFVDILLTGSCILFLVFALLVQAFDGVQVVLMSGLRTSEAFTYISRKGPTILPILFATVVGRASRACIFWRLEVGEKLGILDMLASSNYYICECHTCADHAS
jgi:hypothetical protein